MLVSQFRFSVLSWKHKKWFVLNKLGLFIMMGLMTFIAIHHTNPVLFTREEKMSVSVGVFIGALVFILAMFNLLKGAIKSKALIFFIAWIVLMSMQPIMSTLIWTVGLVTIPLMINDVIFSPIWQNVWYNNYEYKG